MDYYYKYLKYKQKYLNIKFNLMLGGSKNIILKDINNKIINDINDLDPNYDYKFIVNDINGHKTFRINILVDYRKVNVIDNDYFVYNDISKKIFTIDNVNIVWFGYNNVLIICDSRCIFIGKSKIGGFDFFDNEKIINYNDGLIETNLRSFYNYDNKIIYPIEINNNISSYLIKKDIIVPKEKSYSKKYSNITIKSANELVVNDIFEWYGGIIHYNESDPMKIKILPFEQKVTIDLAIDDSNKQYSINNVDTIWLGCGTIDSLYDRCCEHFDNNSILIIAKNIYTCIDGIDGIEMFKFKLFDNEEVIYYQSVYENGSYGYIETNIRYIDIFCSQKFVYKSDYENYIKKGDLVCLEGEYTHPFEHTKISPDIDNDENINNSKKKSKNDRPSPAESATLFEVGTTKKGNDGNMWVITETKSGVKRWSKLKN